MVPPLMRAHVYHINLSSLDQILFSIFAWCSRLISRLMILITQQGASPAELSTVISTVTVYHLIAEVLTWGGWEVLTNIEMGPNLMSIHWVSFDGFHNNFYLATWPFPWLGGLPSNPQSEIQNVVTIWVSKTIQGWGAACAIESTLLRPRFTNDVTRKIRY
jgi:hypothetical protein